MNNQNHSIPARMSSSVTDNPGVYAIAANIISAFGLDITSHWDAVMAGTPSIQLFRNTQLSPIPFYASMLHESQWQQLAANDRYTGLSRFEQLALYSAEKAMADAGKMIDLEHTAFILSTTKGNIEWLNERPDERVGLASSAATIAKSLGIPVKPVVVSHACVSGSVALLYGKRLIGSGRYRHAIVTGCDKFTPFVLNGFQSFQAIADGPCRPFDAGRTGINLGEAAATIILSGDRPAEPLAALLSGATSNDANHISGPSRTGLELSDAIQRALSEAGVTAGDIDMVSTHGTATMYNDEMEAKALNLSGLAAAPVHSMKSYTGHTLGAAGVLESAMVLESIRRQQLIPSAGYETHGVSVPLNVTTKPAPADIRYVLKTASGFGGSNAAIIWGRV